MPLSLTDDQMQTVMMHAEPLQPADRDRYLHRVAALLRDVEIGDGTVGRACAQAQREIFRAPDLRPNAGVPHLLRVKVRCRAFTPIAPPMHRRCHDVSAWCVISGGAPPPPRTGRFAGRSSALASGTRNGTFCRAINPTAMPRACCLYSRRSRNDLPVCWACCASSQPC